MTRITPSCLGSRCTLIQKYSFARIAQLVERVLGKDEVTGSIPVVGSARRMLLGTTFTSKVRNAGSNPVDWRELVVS